MPVKNVQVSTVDAFQGAEKDVRFPQSLLLQGEIGVFENGGNISCHVVLLVLISPRLVLLFFVLFLLFFFR